MNKSEVLPRRPTIDTEVTPRGTLELLSQREVQQLRSTADSRILELFRRCALAVLNTGDDTDDAAALFDAYHDFSIEIVQRTRGLKLNIKNAPASAFVDGRMVEGIRQHLFAVLRDLVYIGTEIENNRRFDLNSSEGITDAVFHILKQARVLVPDVRPNTVVCWGGHSISRVEYEYTKEVGYHLGLRGLDICTGCGPGAMKGPMKGAAIGHVKQRQAGCALHRSDGARHHRCGTAEPDGESPRGAARHREAPRSVRADGPRHRGVSRAASALPRKCCICWAC